MHATVVSMKAAIEHFSVCFCGSSAHQINQRNYIVNIITYLETILKLFSRRFDFSTRSLGHVMTLLPQHQVSYYVHYERTGDQEQRIL